MILATSSVSQWGAPVIVITVVLGAIGLYYTARTFNTNAKTADLGRLEKAKNEGETNATLRLQPVIEDLKAQLVTCNDTVRRRDRAIEVKDERYDRMQGLMQQRINELEDRLRGRDP